MLEEIKGKLRRIEIENEINILYACESGSRAWGFASTDSDYDVRFIYVHKLNDYLSIRDRRDVIEVPVNEVLDIGGWDIRKALQLFFRSNPPLYEWLQSPVVYKSDSSFVRELSSLLPEYFSLRAGCHHYLSIAKNTFENDLQSEQVKLKKYFYALRSALAALWIVEKRTVPPMQFDRLRTLIKDEQWQTTVDHLLESKRVADEKTTITPVPLINKWIEKTLLEVKEKSIMLPVVKHNTELLDQVFRKHIQS
jgi:predicted nucleotidyltransferase